MRWLLAFYVSLSFILVAGAGYFLARCIFELVIAIKEHHGHQEKSSTKTHSTETPL